jgi:UDP-N-acetyl-D-mannosaminuronic acid transferase (WecB/TagA/CpsF family)
MTLQEHPDHERDAAASMDQEALDNWILESDDSIDLTAPDLPGVKLGDGWMHRITISKAVDYLHLSIMDRRGGLVIAVTSQDLQERATDPEFDRKVREASIVLPSGRALFAMAQLQGTPLPEVVDPSALTRGVCERAAQVDHSVFFLGGNDGQAKATATRYSAEVAQLRIAGAMSLPQNFWESPDVLDEIEATLIGEDPDIVVIDLELRDVTRLALTYRDILPDAWFVGSTGQFSELIESPQPRVQRSVKSLRDALNQELMAQGKHAARLLAGAADRGLRRRLQIGGVVAATTRTLRSETTFTPWH